MPGKPFKTSKSDIKKQAKQATQKALKVGYASGKFAVDKLAEGMESGKMQMDINSRLSTLCNDGRTWDDALQTLKQNEKIDRFLTEHPEMCVRFKAKCLQTITLHKEVASDLKRLKKRIETSKKKGVFTFSDPPTPQEIAMARVENDMIDNFFKNTKRKMRSGAGNYKIKNAGVANVRKALEDNEKRIKDATNKLSIEDFDDDDDDNSDLDIEVEKEGA